MSEVIQLDPSAVATGRTMLDITSFVMAKEPGVDWGDAALEAYKASLRIGEVRLEYRLPNRLIKIPLSLRDVGATSFATIRSQLQAKVGLMQVEGGWLMRQVGSTPLYADVQSIDLHLGGSWLQAYRNIDIDAVLAIECFPDWYGDEVTLSDHVETTNPELIFTEPAVLGNQPGRVRIVVDNDDPTNDQHGLLWGIRSRYYDAAATAKLAYEAEALTPVNNAAGTALAGASGGTAVAITPPDGSWTTMLTTQINAGSAQMTHQGTYRVWARVYSAGTTPASYFRFLWGVGGLSVPTVNASAHVPGPSLYLLDLGAIRIDPPPAGNRTWFGAVQTYAASPSSMQAIDRLYFQPLDEGAGRLSYTSIPPVSSITATATAGTATDDAATGSQAWTNPLAITAADGLGAVAQFAASHTTSHYLKASNFGFAVPSGATIRGIEVLVQRYWENGMGADSSVQLIKAGTIQTTNRGDSATPWPSTYTPKVYGSSTDLWSTTWTSSDVNNSGFGVALVASCFIGGHFAHVDYVSMTVYYTLASGFTVAQDAVLYATRSAELRTEGMWRDSGGSVYGPVSQVVGDLPRIPPSGMEGRTVEVFLKASRGNLDDEPDSGIDDISARVFYRPSYLYTGS